MILGETLIRIADRPDEAPFDVSTAVDVIDDPARLRIHEETVDRKIPAADILLGGGEDNPGWVASVVVAGFHPEGGHLVRASPLDDETTPKRAPTGTVRAKSARTSSGRAEVTISKSFGVTPRMRSRTQPPTRKASWPALSQSADDGGGIIQRHARPPGDFSPLPSSAEER